jgi:hypothetical protein
MVLRRDYAGINRDLCRINVERSECYLKTDQDRIFAVVRSMPGGTDAFNNAVMILIRDWMAAAAKKMIDGVSAGDETAAQLDDLMRTADLLSDQGDYPGAKVLYERALKGREKVLGPDHADTLSVSK